MTKKKFIIIFSVLVVAFGGLLAALIYKGALIKHANEELGEEYLFYSQTFDLTLSKDKSYYIVSDLTDKAKSLETVKFPQTIDGIPLKQWHVNNSGVSYRNATSIIIPYTMEYIGKDYERKSKYGDSFVTSTGSELVNFVVEAGNPTYTSKDGVLYSADGKTLLRFPNSKSTDMALKVVIDDETEEIYDEAFYYNLYVRQITLSSSVKTIGKKAFFHCDNLTTFVMPEGLEKLSERTFAYSAIQVMDLPHSLKTIETNTFSSCNHLEAVVIHEETVDIGNQIFSANADTLNVYTEESNIAFLKSKIRESSTGKVVIITSLDNFHPETK